MSDSNSNSRKRKCAYLDVDIEELNYSNEQDTYLLNNDIKTSNIGNNKIIVVQKNNELLQSILNNQLYFHKQLNDLHTYQEKKYKNLSDQMHQLQINISNYESIIPNIIKDKIKDCVGEILFIIEDNKIVEQLNDISLCNEKKKYYF
jgi:hypothetical protein